jgi:hypothetical protein
LQQLFCNHNQLHCVINFALHYSSKKDKVIIDCSSIISNIYQLLSGFCPMFCLPPAPGLYGMAPKLLLRIF